MNLSRDSHGRLVLQEADGTAHAGVVPVRAFPLTDPDGAISLVGSDGRERLWVADPAALPETARALLAEELARREFAPVIERLLDVSTFSTPSTWSVRTDRGDAQLVLKGEEDIRRLAGTALLITDSHGVGYRIADARALDKRSRRLLERFL
ncbi:MAG TPA: DUF1854 domain-containing protein [Piscinibacter sp.]|jgi:hypothetical protein|uniref:cyanophycin metabolism-associated DUF1854 family protein n=1 Tax=Piscinibacter sp. TaxID=1903157 RepID=UPI001B3F1A4B|nr:DUF1854 domain-containing protein [Piscinibacter sp.]MBP5989122.1 DUF1854 domain-containing protein [Piscinibacter sp.]MBP6026158.1 DUF1854 domain-containing protein [Piscinibacter sp.]HNJ84091.1 DUF1854 domain-containing protein [Piscinibacter sp.]HNK17223.1 DUF1854 domain-containing protein [Piscinibacter sp.]